MVPLTWYSTDKFSKTTKQQKIYFSFSLNENEKVEIFLQEMRLKLKLLF